MDSDPDSLGKQSFVFAAAADLPVLCGEISMVPNAETTQAGSRACLRLKLDVELRRANCGVFSSCQEACQISCWTTLQDWDATDRIQSIPSLEIAEADMSPY